jgi:multimeric flavodoxin WrbA
MFNEKRAKKHRLAIFARLYLRPSPMDVLNKYFLKTNMPVVPSQYWSIAHGTAPGEVVRDEEGMQTMRQLGLNMAFMIKSIRLGLQQFGSPKILEELIETNYIR